MFKIKYLAVVLCGLASTLTMAPGAAQEITAAPAQLSDTGQFLDGVVAIVNEGIVLRSDLDLQIKTISTRAQAAEMALPPANILEEQVLERLIVEEVQLQRAEMVGIRISDQMLNTIKYLSTFKQTNLLKNTLLDGYTVHSHNSWFAP